MHHMPHSASNTTGKSTGQWTYAHQSLRDVDHGYAKGPHWSPHELWLTG